jgi:Na+-driven multidrug efflux pump
MTLVSFVVYHLLCRRKWPEMVRWSFVREWKDYRDVLHFNNWNLLHSSAVISRSQGSNMLINAFFGTMVNAAFYYAATLQNYVSQFISNFDTASAPQIAQSVGSGEIPQATALARRTGRICLLLFLLLFFPLWCEMDFIVELWLGKNVPAETFLMCRWTLVVAAVSATSAGLVQLINALGRIKWYKIEVSVLFFGCLLAGWLLFRAGFPAYTIIVSFVVADLLNRLIQFILLRFQFRFDVAGYFREAYLRPFMVFVLMGAYLLIYPHFGFDGIWLRLLGVFITLILSMLAVLFVGLTPSERSSLKRFVFRRA